MRHRISFIPVLRALLALSKFPFPCIFRSLSDYRKSACPSTSEKAVYRCESCEGCPYRLNCTKAKRNKTLAVSHRFKELRAESLENISGSFGKRLRMNRSIQAEHKYDTHTQKYIISLLIALFLTFRVILIVPTSGFFSPFMATITPFD